MDNFMTSFGSENYGGGEDAGPGNADLQLLFQNMIASDHAVNETIKSRKSGIEVSIIYIGSARDSGESFARRIAHTGGGSYYTVKKINDLPGMALEVIK